MMLYYVSFFLILWRPPRSKRPYTRFPYTPLFRSEAARRGSFDAPSRGLRQRGRSVHAGAAFEEQGLADRRLHRAFLERFGDQEGRLRSFAGQQPVGIGGDEDDRHLEVAEDVADRKSTRLNSSH